MPNPAQPRPARLRLVMVRRVSTIGQAVDGYGLDAQDSDCRRWNKAAGHRLVHTVVDGDQVTTSGASTIDERDGLMDAMQWIADGRADGILAPNLDRLARELTVQEAILAYVWALGGAVFTADHGEHLEDDEDDPMRTAMRQMRGVFHQLDRGLIRKRLRGGRHAKGEQGGYAYGAPPFGKKAVDNELADDDTETATLTLMRRWRDEEGLGHRAICRRLNEMRRPAKRGGQWHPSTVALALDEEARAAANARSARARARVKEEKKRTRAAKILGGIG
jgi:DNA invertase Pin-like site-specific DNA recombinase